jgi:hypothetical protein
MFPMQMKRTRIVSRIAGKHGGMNPLLFPPTLIKRALDDLSAIADAARRLPALEQQVLDRIDTISGKALVHLAEIRKGIAPLDDDMRAVRDSVDELEPLLIRANERLERLHEELAPLGELADKIPGIGR